MKSVLLIALVLVLSASVVFAQPRVGLYADNLGNACDVADGAGAKQVYCLVTGIPFMTGVQFKATVPACWTGASYLADASQSPVTIGNSQTGIAIAFGTCQATPKYVLSITYLTSGATSACCVYPLTPDPSVPSGSIEFVDCSSNQLFGVGQSGVITPTGGPLPNCACVDVVPAETSTWGQVKAIFSTN